MSLIQEIGDDSVDNGTTEACPSCGCSSNPNDMAPEKIAIGLSHISKCQHCGLMFTEKRLNGDDWNEHYPPDYRPHQVACRNLTRRSSIRQCAFLSQSRRLSVVQSLRRRLNRNNVIPNAKRRFHDPYGSGRLLDVGCGAGDYLAAMRDRGWEGIGIDRSTRAAETAQQHFGIPVVVGELPTAELSPHSFDLITAWQSLEHFDQPRRAIRAVRDLLSGEGYFALSVPNAASWSAETFGSAWIGWDVPRHAAHYTPATLNQLLTSEGFYIIDSCTIGRSSWIRHSARQVDCSNDNKRLGRYRNRFYSRWAAAWSQLRGKGDTIHVLARRLDGG